MKKLKVPDDDDEDDEDDDDDDDDDDSLMLPRSTFTYPFAPRRR